MIKKCSKLVEILPNPEINVLPVIEAGPAHRLLIERESQRFHEVKGGAGGEGESSGRSGIVWDFWFDEDDVHGGGSF